MEQNKQNNKQLPLYTALTPCSASQFESWFPKSNKLFNDIFWYFKLTHFTFIVFTIKRILSILLTSHLSNLILLHAS